MNTRWTYYVEGTQVHPLNTRSLRIKETLEDEYIHDYRKSLEGSIVLMNDYKNNHLDYDFIKGLETTKLHEKLTFQMYDGGTLAFTGEFTILDCKFNERQGICEFQVQPVDDYTYIQENEDIECNILQTDKHTISADLYSSILFEIKAVCDIDPPWSEPADETYRKLMDYYYPGEGLPNIYWSLYATEVVIVSKKEQEVILTLQNAGWNLYVETDDFYIYNRYPQNFDPDTYPCLISGLNPLTEYFWTAKVTCLPEDESEWTYTKFIPCYDNPSGLLAAYKDVFYRETGVYIKKSYYNGRLNNILTRYYNAYKLKDCLNRILTYAMPDQGEIKSTLLFGDPQETGKVLPSGYDELTSVYDKYLIEMSDFKKPSASEAATKSIVSWKQISEYLCDKHNARWFIDADGNLRFEHIIYFDTSEETDISSDKGLTLSYSYLQDEKPNREFFTEQQAWSEDFMQIEILYGTVPILAGSKESTKSRSLSVLYTDIDGLNAHLDKLSNDGFVYVDVSDGAVVKATGFKSGVTNLQNANLSMANCLNLYHRHNAYQSNFYIAGKPVSALTLKKMKKQELTFMRDNPLDVRKKLVTRIGTGIITELSYAPTQEVFYENTIVVY